MEIRKAQGMFSWLVIASEVSHVFCCVLPSLFSVLTILIGMGVLGAMPLWMDGFHDIMHNYEIPLMAMSGTVVLLGWALHFVAKRIDCRDTGCSHGGCSSSKRKSLRILKIATVLFVVNVAIYATLHKGVGLIHTSGVAAVESDEPHNHHHH
jgi:hypothetical protein